MSNQGFQPRLGRRAGRLLVCAILVAGGWGVGTGAAEAAEESALQNPAPPPTASGKEAPPTKPKAPRPQSSKAPAEGTPATEQPQGGVAGGRDPFKIPPPPTPNAGGQPSPSMAGGIKGLVISQLSLEGIVRMDATKQLFAVVTNYTHRAYFLHENDTLFDGVVSKITPDAVYFRENRLDPDGHVTTSEVVKRLGPAPGEGR